MTFTSASGVCYWNIPGINDMFGNLLQLPNKAYNIDTGLYFDPKETRPGLACLEERCRAAWRLDRLYNCEKRLARTKAQLQMKRMEIAALANSTSYRIGLFIT